MSIHVEPLAVSPATAAEMLDCSRAFIYTLIERGDLRRSKIGRASRIPIEDIRALLNEGIAR
jgi:excisionase family DNA binding protein